MKKLNAKQLQTLPKDKYHDGNGLYISISKPGRGKWSFRYTTNKKSPQEIMQDESIKNELVNKVYELIKVGPNNEKSEKYINTLHLKLNDN